MDAESSVGIDPKAQADSAAKISEAGRGARSESGSELELRRRCGGWIPDWSSESDARIQNDLELSSSMSFGFRSELAAESRLANPCELYP